MIDGLILFFEPLVLNLDHFWGLLFLLVFGHCLADYALQSPEMQHAKNSTKNPKEIWIPVLFAHSMIHAGIVFAITGYFSLAILQIVTHFIIDYAKAVQKTYSARASFLIDQFLHVAVLGITAGFFCIDDPLFCAIR